MKDKSYLYQVRLSVTPLPSSSRHSLPAVLHSPPLSSSALIRPLSSHLPHRAAKQHPPARSRPPRHAILTAGSPASAASTTASAAGNRSGRPRDRQSLQPATTVAFPGRRRRVSRVTAPHRLQASQEGDPGHAGCGRPPEGNGRRQEGRERGRESRANRRSAPHRYIGRRRLAPSHLVACSDAIPAWFVQPLPPPPGPRQAGRRAG